MAARTTVELVPLLASLLISAPTWALEPCAAASGDTLQCGRDLIRVRGLNAPQRGEPGADEARESLQRIVSSGRVRLEPRSHDGRGRLVADLYVSEVRIRQQRVGDFRPPIEASSCSVVDGDTLRCGRERVRIRGVYAGERGERGAQAARARLERVIASGELRLVRRAFDRYGRTVADLYVDGRRIRQRDIGPRGGSGSGH